MPSKSLACQIAIVVTFASLAACGQAEAENGGAAANFKLNWQDLPDGSSFSIGTTDKLNHRIGLRCWDAEGMKECLVITESKSDGMVSIVRAREPELPDVVFYLADTSNGYNCADMGGAVSELLGSFEEIKKEGYPVVTNEARTSGEAWSGQYVRNYMAENEIDGSGWFDCARLVSTVRKGSLASLGTMSVTREMAGY